MVPRTAVLGRTKHDLLIADQNLRAEADGILEARGLRRLLEEYAPIHITGSYTLQLMVCRDLDLLMESPGTRIPEFFELGTCLEPTVPVDLALALPGLRMFC